MKKIALDYGLIALGSFLLAFGVQFFLVPLNVSTGGISGLALLFLRLFHIPLSVTTLVCNVLLFFFAYRTLPRAAIPKNMAGILFLSLFLELLEGVHFRQSDMFIASVFGGIVVGVGVGLVVMRDGSTGGSDFAGLILNRIFPQIGIAHYIFFIDCIVILASGIVFHDLSIMFYSVISIYVSAQVTDLLLVRGTSTKAVTVVSDHSDAIAHEIMEKLERGVTGLYAHGFYRAKDGRALLCVVKSREVQEVLKIVKACDPTAFTYLTDAKKVMGEGFLPL